MDRIVGYTYAADIYCTGECVTDALGAAQIIRGVGTTESLLDSVAESRGIDRMDERSFDSSAFPKVVFGTSVEDGERCGGCGEKIG
jgi:hypothetical protein